MIKLPESSTPQEEAVLMCFRAVLARYHDTTACILALVKVAGYASGFLHPVHQLSPGEIIGCFTDRHLLGADHLVEREKT